MPLIALAFAGCPAPPCRNPLATPDATTRDRRGDQPPPSGGIAAV